MSGVGMPPLWLLVAMVDDDPDEGPDHYNFNEDLAAKVMQLMLLPATAGKQPLTALILPITMVILSPTPLTASHFLQKPPQPEKAAGPPFI